MIVPLVQMFGPQVLEDPALATLTSPNPRTPKSPRSPGMKPMAIFELLGKKHALKNMTSSLQVVQFHKIFVTKI